MSNSIAVLPPNQTPQLGELVLHQLSNQQKAWLAMAETKNELVRTLTAKELEAQATLLPVKDSQDYKAIDAAIAEYKKQVTTLSEIRKDFTNKINSGIVQPLMAYENRAKEYETLLLLEARSLTLRKQEADRVRLENEKNAEITRFKAHLENEGFRVAAAYRALLRAEISKQYEIALKEKLFDLPVLKATFRTLPIPAANKFVTTLLPNEEMLAIYQEAKKPDFESIYNEYMKELESTFANFESDLLNASAAVEHNQQQAKLADIQEQKELQESVAINTLIHTAQTVVVETPKIKRQLQIVVVESEQWAKAVIASFIIHLPKLSKWIRVKSWANLSIGQMADALSKLASEEQITFNNLELKEIEK